MPYARVFDLLWHGRRHALVGPVRVDRFGQANISCIGDHAKPKAQMLGMRGYPGNSIPRQHLRARALARVRRGVDVVSAVHPARWRRGGRSRSAA
jgi:glutaconate CoA-transferase subunit B